MSRPEASQSLRILQPLCHWDGVSPLHFENWSFSLKPGDGAPGLWFEYALEAPERGLLLAAAFNRRDRGEQFFIRRASPLRPLDAKADSLEALDFGDGLLLGDGLRGTLEDGERRLGWDLRFAPDCDFAGGPARLGFAPFADLRVSGAVTINGRELRLRDAPGCLARRWGRQRPLESVRVHCADFEGETGTRFEAHAVRLSRPGMPVVVSLALRHRGETHRFTRLRLARQWRRNLGVGYWTFAAMNGRVYLEGSAQCRLRDMFAVEGADPDGRLVRMRISRLANLKIRLFRRVRGLRYRYVETLRAHATAHLESCRRFPEAGAS